MFSLNTLQLLTLTFLVNHITSAPLTCDSLEYILNNRKFQQPAGVCYSTGDTKGTMLACNQANNDMDYKYFHDPNCNGNSFLTASVRDTMDALGISETDYTITCCTGLSCEYSIERTYETASCSDDISTASTWTDNVNIINGCSGFFDVGVNKYTTCLNNISTIKDFYAHQRICNGTSETTTIAQDQCNADGTQIGIICGTAPLTCAVTTTSHPTTDPTGFPTQQPTFISTIVTNQPTQIPTQMPTETDRDSNSHSRSHSSSDLNSHSSSIESGSSDSSSMRHIKPKHRGNGHGDKTENVIEYGDGGIKSSKIKSDEFEKIVVIMFVGVICFIIMLGLIASSCVFYRKYKTGHIKVSSVETDEEIVEENDINEMIHGETLNIIST